MVQYRDAKTMLFAYILSVIVSSISAQEESVSINKPRTRIQQPWVQINTDNVRCFCNLPPCVGTGYMCKSSNGGCFSEFVEPARSSVYRGRHGCIEYLSESQRYRCPLNNKEGTLKTHVGSDQKSLLVCCTNDLCNHVDNPNTKNLLNNSLDDPSDKVHQHNHQEEILYSSSEVWFRAATIAVPICGAVILFVLIALAVKILKSEDRSSPQYKLGPSIYAVPSEQNEKWPEYNPKQCLPKRTFYSPSHPGGFVVRHNEEPSRPFEMPLLVEMGAINSVNSSCISVNESKNETNAKLNLINSESNSSRSIILEIGKTSNNYSFSTNLNSNSDDKYEKHEKLLMS